MLIELNFTLYTVSLQKRLIECTFFLCLHERILDVGDTDNNLFNIAGTELRVNDAAQLLPSSYLVNIKVSDGHQNYKQSFTITVIDDIAPSYINGMPTLTDTTVSSTLLNIVLNEVGTSYSVIIESRDPVPSVSQT